MTADYTVSGTPQFMSPEQATASQDIDGRADIYSLGAILYFMLTGRPPFEGKNPTELMIAHARDPVVPPSRHRADIPADLEAVVVRCLEKKPEARYPDTRTLSTALAACACAGDWNDEKADAWWVDQATTPDAGGARSRAGPRAGVRRRFRGLAPGNDPQHVANRGRLAIHRRWSTHQAQNQ